MLDRRADSPLRWIGGPSVAGKLSEPVCRQIGRMILPANQPGAICCKSPGAAQGKFSGARRSGQRFTNERSTHGRFRLNQTGDTDTGVACRAPLDQPRIYLGGEPFGDLSFTALPVGGVGIPSATASLASVSSEGRSRLPPLSTW